MKTTLTQTEMRDALHHDGFSGASIARLILAARLQEQQLHVGNAWYYWSIADRVFVETGPSRLNYTGTNRETVADVPSDSQYSWRVF